MTLKVYGLPLNNSNGQQHAFVLQEPHSNAMHHCETCTCLWLKNLAIVSSKENEADTTFHEVYISKIKL